MRPSVTASTSPLPGFSLGGWQALSIGLEAHRPLAWVAGFSPALVSDVLPAPIASVEAALAVLAANSDSLKGTCEVLHQTLERRMFPHLAREPW